MGATYRAVMLQGRGGLDRLEDVELPLTDPKPGELRDRVRATGAGYTDVMMRTGYYPYRPAFPFVPGYELVGDVDAIGDGVSGFKKGDRVCALTVYGGYAEYFTRDADDFVAVPAGLDDADVVSLPLNYVTAYQMIHRVAKLRAHDTALVTGANGGVGSAAIELLRAHGSKGVGAASKKHFDLVKELGGEPIESRTKPLDEALHALYPDGVDATLDGLGGAATSECVRATKKDGIVVGYGFMAAGPSLLGSVRGFTSLYAGSFFAGRRAAFYGITKLYRKDKRPFKEDMPKLFELLAAKKIRPRIAAKLPLLAAKEAQRMLEAGGVAGKIVHVA